MSCRIRFGCGGMRRCGWSEKAFPSPGTPGEGAGRGFSQPMLLLKDHVAQTPSAVFRKPDTPAAHQPQYSAAHPFPTSRLLEKPYVTDANSAHTPQPLRNQQRIHMTTRL